MLLNRDRAYDVMEKYGIEAIIATMPENVTYLTDYWSLTHRLIKATQNFAVITRKQDLAPFIITSVNGDPTLGHANIGQAFCQCCHRSLFGFC